MKSAEVARSELKNVSTAAETMIEFVHPAERTESPPARVRQCQKMRSSFRKINVKKWAVYVCFLKPSRNCMVARAESRSQNHGHMLLLLLRAAGREQTCSYLIIGWSEHYFYPPRDDLRMLLEHHWQIPSFKTIKELLLKKKARTKNRILSPLNWRQTTKQTTFHISLVLSLLIAAADWFTQLVCEPLRD